MKFMVYLVVNGNMGIWEKIWKVFFFCYVWVKFCGMGEGYYLGYDGRWNGEMDFLRRENSMENCCKFIDWLEILMFAKMSFVSFFYFSFC